MQLRFDGTIGFTGGIVDTGETPTEACTRECCEELGIAPGDLVITADNHIVTHYSTDTRFCLHFYAKEISLELLKTFECKVPFASDWGQEVFRHFRPWFLYACLIPRVALLHAFSPYAGAGGHKVPTLHATQWAGPPRLPQEPVHRQREGTAAAGHQEAWPSLRGGTTKSSGV